MNQAVENIYPKARAEKQRESEPMEDDCCNYSTLHALKRWLYSLHTLHGHESTKLV